MKGNLIHLNMAESDCTVPHLSPDYPSNYSLQMACSLLLDDDHVAVADQKVLSLWRYRAASVRQMLQSLSMGQRAQVKKF